MIRIVIVDELLLTRTGIISMIQGCSVEDCTVVGDADNGYNALTLISSLRPDLVFTDIKLPYMNGLQLIEAVQSSGIQTRFIVLSDFDDIEYIRQSIHLGVFDYILKSNLNIKTMSTLLKRLKQLEYQSPNYHVFSEAQTGQNAIAEHTDTDDKYSQQSVYNEVSTYSYLEEIDCIISKVEQLLENHAINDFKHTFSSSMQRIQSIGRSIPTNLLCSICFMLTYQFDRYYSAVGVESTNWNKTSAIKKLVDGDHSCEQYLDFVDELHVLCITVQQSRRKPNNLMVEATQYIKKNFHDDISLHDLAANANLNPNYFSRLFSKEFGLSFSDYLTSIRIGHAKYLLTNTEGKISEISEQCGYNSQFYFSRVFKKFTGKTPAYWRKNTERK